MRRISEMGAGDRTPAALDGLDELEHHRERRALVTQQRNEEMKALAESGHAQNEELEKISSWAAILSAPTLLGTIYAGSSNPAPAALSCSSQRQGEPPL